MSGKKERGVEVKPAAYAIETSKEKEGRAATMPKDAYLLEQRKKTPKDVV